MNIEEKVKMNLLTRGFDNKTQLNNRGLIGATIDETILEVVKNLRIAECRYTQGRSSLRAILYLCIVIVGLMCGYFRSCSIPPFIAG